jgi:RPA family protein
MLEAWLASRPGPELLDTWEAMTRALCAQFASAERKALEEEVMGRARRVADATGGFLGFGDRVSIEERAVMERLAKAFR